MSKALELLKSNTPFAERAEDYVKTASRNIQQNFINSLVARKEALNDKISDKKNFSVITEKGISEASRSSIEQRLSEILEAEYQLKLLVLELEAKQALFNEYFEEEAK